MRWGYENNQKRLDIVIYSNWNNGKIPHGYQLAVEEYHGQQK